MLLAKDRAGCGKESNKRYRESERQRRMAKKNDIGFREKGNTKVSAEGSKRGQKKKGTPPTTTATGPKEEEAQLAAE